jgi:spore maturation protein CgeB
MACAIPFVSARWDQTSGLFDAGRDFLVAHDGAEMAAHLEALIADDDRRRALAAHGLDTVRRRHTCGHRVDELVSIYEEIRPS